MTPKEIWNRGNNLVAVAIVALTGFAYAPESYFEPEVPFKIDDMLLFVLGIGAIGWYVWGKNKWKRSIIPVYITYGAFLTKIVAVFIEFKDKEDVVDDFGAMVLLLLASLLVTFLYVKAKRALGK